MAKIVDITEKLNFEDKPQIKIKNEVLTVNNEAVTMLKITPLVEDNSLSAANEICRLLFSGDDMQKLESLHLSFSDLATLIKTAVELIVGDTPGEAATHATT